MPPGFKCLSLQHVCPLDLCPGQELARQSRLANTDLSFQQDDLRLTALYAMIDPDQRAQLRCPPQKGAVEEHCQGKRCRGYRLFPARRRRHGTYAVGQGHGLRSRLGLHGCSQPLPAHVIGAQGTDPVPGCELQAHQPLVGVLMQRVEGEPAVDRCHGRLKLSRFKLEEREPVEDLIDVQVPVCALRAYPVVEVRRITQRKALQELAAREAGCALEPGELAAPFAFWQVRSCVSWRAR